MKFLYDLFPLLLFFAAFKFYDIYVATAVAIVASFLQTGLFWLKHRRFETMHLITLAIIAVFGGLTLLVHWLALQSGDGETIKVILFNHEFELKARAFIKIKPTAAYWTLSTLLLGSHLFKGKSLLGQILSKQVTLPEMIWARLNFSWGIFFLLVGALNIYIAFYYGPNLDEQTRENIWVYFKVPGTIALTLLFAIAQSFYMAKHMQDKSEDDKSTSNGAAD